MLTQFYPVLCRKILNIVKPQQKRLSTQNLYAFRRKVLPNFEAKTKIKTTRRDITYKLLTTKVCEKFRAKETKGVQLPATTNHSIFHYRLKPSNTAILTEY